MQIMTDKENQVPVLPEVHLNIYNKKEPVEVPIIENRIVTSGYSPNFVRHITFDVSGTELENNIKVGQSVGILPPGVDDKGKPHALRLYSVASPSNGEDGQGKQYSTTVKRLIDEHAETQELFMGICSNYLAALKPGAMVKMTGPSGKRFLLPENAGDYNYIFVATGTGIAPFRGMIKEIMDFKSESEIALIFGCAYRTDLLYESYFNELDNQKDNFHYLKSISREGLRADGTKHYVQYQFIDNRALLYPMLAKENTLVYICGLKGMEYPIYRTLAQEGLHQYLKLKPEASQNPNEWTDEDYKRNIKPSERLFVETY